MPHFKVRRANSVKTEMSGWSLPPDIRATIDADLAGLGNDPDSKLIDAVDETGRPIKARRRLLTDPRDRDCTHDFMFHVEFDIDGVHLNVLGCDYERRTPDMDAGTPVL